MTDYEREAAEREDARREFLLRDSVDRGRLAGEELAREGLTVVDPDEPSREEIEDAAILLMAADARLAGDWWSAPSALEWARRLSASLETDEMYAEGLHHGDCTRHAHTCSRCVVERARAEARARFDAE